MKFKLRLRNNLRTEVARRAYCRGTIEAGHEHQRTEASGGYNRRGDGKEIEGSGSASEKIEIVREGDIVIEIDQAMSGDSPSELEQVKLDILRSLGVSAFQIDSSKRSAGVGGQSIRLRKFCQECQKSQLLMNRLLNCRSNLVGSFSTRRTS